MINLMERPEYKYLKSPLAEVAVDIDGTCSTLNMLTYCLNFITGKYLQTDDLTTYDLSVLYDIEPRLLDEIMYNSRLEVYRHSLPNRQVLYALNKLSAKDIHISYVSCRELGDEEETSNWLKKNFFPVGRVTHYGKRILKTSELSPQSTICLVDDNASEIDLAKNKGIKGILISAPYNQDYKCDNEMTFRVDLDEAADLIPRLVSEWLY
jgi:uncharacterized HAD superfamily protein